MSIVEASATLRRPIQPKAVALVGFGPFFFDHWWIWIIDP